MSGHGRGRKAFDKRAIQASFTGHLTGLPQDILSLFQPGPPLTYIKPIKTRSKMHSHQSYRSIADYIFIINKAPDIETPQMLGKIFVNKEYKHQVRLSETILEKIAREHRHRSDERNSNLLKKMKVFNPLSDLNVDGDPFKTLFVARLPAHTTERNLRREFENFGPVLRVRIISDKLTGKPRGYAFIELEHADDVKRAYRMGFNSSIEGRRIVIDVERGRTVRNWRPKRLGGGLEGQSTINQSKKPHLSRSTTTSQLDTNRSRLTLSTSKT